MSDCDVSDAAVDVEMNVGCTRQYEKSTDVKECLRGVVGKSQEMSEMNGEDLDDRGAPTTSDPPIIL